MKLVKAIEEEDVSGGRGREVGRQDPGAKSGHLEFQGSYGKSSSLRAGHRLEGFLNVVDGNGGGSSLSVNKCNLCIPAM